ncbi:hypothetical protein B0T14DRAFT_42861 [Immersiella caudata]|uniref:Uncharacterized protein n=1 Tax=Immersiella caudata TaxID=314043 RepID=A0AA39XF27_9PEZI|nr:hypothetical protein B0T14DRAFT_42861 [Immersiella caudata]
MQEKAENVITFLCNVTHHANNSPNLHNTCPVPAVRTRRTKSSIGKSSRPCDDARQDKDSDSLLLLRGQAEPIHGPTARNLSPTSATFVYLKVPLRTTHPCLIGRRLVVIRTPSVVAYAQDARQPCPPVRAGGTKRQMRGRGSCGWQRQLTWRKIGWID